MRWPRSSALWLGFAAAAIIPSAVAAERPARPEPPGPYARPVDSGVLAAKTFRAERPVVGTYYFYWYDVDTGEHWIDGDGSDALTDHPSRSEGYSYRSTEWHARELRDIMEAGLDFVLPVYWGYPGDYEAWSFVGLKALVEAARTIEREGGVPPRIGLFYDTSTLAWNSRGFHADLTTPEGKEWLYLSARDFFSLVPPDLWATVEGRPLLWLYAAGFAKRQDPEALDSLRAEFRKDFGVEPFVVKEVSWVGRADATYAWGAALRPSLHGIAAVGPGYDHSAVPGRTPLVREREGGAFYARSWEWVLSRDPARRPMIAIVETWNELHEGTEIAPTREHGRRYVELTRKYADLWRGGERLRRTGPYAQAREVAVSLGRENRGRGLSQKDCEDGKTEPVRIDGGDGRKTVQTPHAGRYIYFDVDDGFYYDDAEPLEVELRFLDEGQGPIVLEYDSADPAAPHAGAFKALEAGERGGAGGWRTTRVRLPDPAFVGRSNGFDLRLSSPGADLTLSSLAVRKLTPRK